ncbi:uncharacterized protein BT62DRAFT_822882, partial [Guyanagaster necrorhizus]
PTTKALYEGLWKQPFQNKIADFIWKTIHDVNKGGKYFKHFKPEAQYCACGEIESMDHILHRCEKSGQSKVWKRIGKLW